MSSLTDLVLAYGRGTVSSFNRSPTGLLPHSNTQLRKAVHCPMAPRSSVGLKQDTESAGLRAPEGAGENPVEGVEAMAWAKTSRHERGYGTAWDKLRALVLQRDKHLCQPCLRKRKVTPATSVNHVKPKAQGGTDDPANLESICDPCHDDETLRQQGKRVRPRISLDGWPE